jgi:hypothetical protein
MKKFMILSSIILSSGCTGSVDKHWKCKNPEGKGCVSIKESDQGSDLHSGHTHKAKKKTPSYVLKLDAQKRKKAGEQTDFIYKRTKEKTERIWFAPFLDEEGNQHEESYVRIVIKKPKWVISNEIK